MTNDASLIPVQLIRLAIAVGMNDEELKEVFCVLKGIDNEEQMKNLAYELISRLRERGVHIEKRLTRGNEMNALQTMTQDTPFNDYVSLGECRVPEDTPPSRFAIGDRVVVNNNCEPENWDTAVITGINLLIKLHCAPAWEYCLRFDDYAGGGVEWLSENLYHERRLQELRKEWELNQMLENDEVAKND
jgi:hypothetical protein